MTIPSPRLHASLLSLALLPAVLLSGCASWRDSGPMKLVKMVDIPDGIPWKSERVRRGQPRRMVATWTDTVKQTPGMEAERGFGGRLFFYDTSAPKPIGVEGQLVVYAFDETDRLPTDSRPTKRYVFPPEQLTLHESKSDLGVSYSVWLPWDKVGGAQKEVSLIARFEPTKGGTLIVSDQTQQRLPGRLESGETLLAAQKPSPTVQVAQATGQGGTGVQAAAYQTPAASPPKPEQSGRIGLQSTTIKLPSRR